jgi:hypothetical protein
MTWLTWLLLAVLVAAVAAFTGIKPRGTRPVERTRLMSVARLVLVVGVILAAYFIYGARG